jgi:hypothetical protein
MTERNMREIILAEALFTSGWNQPIGPLDEAVADAEIASGALGSNADGLRQ